MTTKKGDPRLLVHTPAELATSYVQLAESIQASVGIPFGLTDLDKYIIPMRPGNLVALTARPGHGKTSIMAYLAKKEAERIIARGRQNEECVVYITLEQAAEELEAFFQSGKEYSVSEFAWGKVDLDLIKRQAVKRAAVPIWVIGHGIGRAGEGAPRMFPDTLMDAIESMQQDFGVKPTLLLFDYIQLIPVREAEHRVEQVTEAPIRVKELAERVGAVAVIGVQAKQEVDVRNEKIPGPSDAQWASAIHQTADKHFALMRPILYYEEGQAIRIEGQTTIKITPNLFVLRMLKQRFAEGRHTWLLHFDPNYLTLEELELKRQNFDDWDN